MVRGISILNDISADFRYTFTFQSASEVCAILFSHL